MQEILPGLYRWTTFHEDIRADVSSHYVEPAGALIDPRVPDDGLDAFTGLTTPQQVVLTSGLHVRHSDRFADAFGCVVRASPEAIERHGGALDARVYEDGDEVAPGITAIHIGALAPDEYALHVDIDGGAICFADALVGYAGTLGFFSDSLLGDDPAAVKSRLRDAFSGLLTRDFEHLLFAHGDPVIGHGKTALRRFLEQPVGHEDYGQVV
jgi:hypothetical protein